MAFEKKAQIRMVIVCDVNVGTSALTGSQQLCTRCSVPVVRRRRTSTQNSELCTACDQRERRAAYFRSYYEEHKDKILHKNRRWAKDNKPRIVQLRQARRIKDETSATGRKCLDCDTQVTRAVRCRKCYIRYRYATDPTYRTRRLATTRRWLEKRQRNARPRNDHRAQRTAAVVPMRTQKHLAQVN